MVKRKYYNGILFSLILASALCSCGEQKTNSKLLINEVLIENESSQQDEYGMRSGWIEIFNKSYGSADLSGGSLKVSGRQGDTVTYIIPKGDVLTVVKPRQHALFWADGFPRKGTFHTNFRLNPETSNWIGLYDSGGKLLDQMTVPANVITADQSYARVSDAAAEWEVKDGSEEKYVTPSTNNKTLDSSAKTDKFAKHDPSGIGMAISAMSVVFSGLILLFVCFYLIGKQSIRYSKRKAMDTHHIDKEEAKEKGIGINTGEVMAAIAMALHEAKGDGHDVEETILTISRVNRYFSPWSSKRQSLREVPKRK